MFYAIYSGKFFLSSIGATNIYINLEILEVAEIIENCIFLKFIITKKKKKNLINNIYYLTKCHLHNFCFKKKKINDKNGQKHDPIQEIPKKKNMQNNFHRRVYL